MFDDADWIKKLAIGGGIAFIGLILSPILIGLVILLMITGYMLEVLKNVRDGRPLPLPEWTDFGDLLRKGFMVGVIGFVYNIPALLFVCATQAANFGLTSTTDTDTASALGIAVACLACLQIIFSLIAAILLPAGMIRYARYETLGSAFQFGEIYRFISSNIGDYAIVVILGIVAQFIAGLGIILCFIGFFFTFFWSILVMGNLYGQLARKAAI
jgi:hypothetical protein